MVTGVILAGGPASRFGGQPKGLQMVAGERIIDRLARALRSATDALLIVSNDERATEWIADVPVAGDVLTGQASAVGIHAALTRAGRDVIVVAWDMPFVPGALLQEVRRRLAGGVTAVVPCGPHGPEPVCAGYAFRALPHVERLAESGALRLSAMIETLPGAIQIPLAEVARLGDPGTMFFNVNTAEDLRRAQEIAERL